jgi:hypothetical protein
MPKYLPVGLYPGTRIVPQTLPLPPKVGVHLMTILLSLVIPSQEGARPFYLW